MGRFWVTINGKRKRTKAGIQHELGVIPFIDDSGFERGEIFSAYFYPLPPSIWEHSISPRRFVTTFDEGDVLFSRSAITTNRISGIITVLLGGNETQIAASVIKSIPVDMVYKHPSIIWSTADYCIMDKVTLKPCIAVYMKIQAFPHIMFFPNIFIEFSVPDKLVFIIVQRSFDPITMVNSFLKHTLSSYRGEKHLAMVSSPIVLASVFNSFKRVFIWHIGIIPRTIKFHKKEGFYGKTMVY